MGDWPSFFPEYLSGGSPSFPFSFSWPVGRWRSVAPVWGGQAFPLCSRGGGGGGSFFNSIARAQQQGHDEHEHAERALFFFCFLAPIKYNEIFLQIQMIDSSDYAFAISRSSYMPRLRYQRRGDLRTLLCISAMAP